MSKRKRLTVLLVIGGLLIGGGWAYRYFVLLLPTGAGPAGPSVPRSAFNEIWTQRPVQLVTLGDSVTASFGASAGHGYVERLVRNPPNEFADMRGICLGAVLPQLRVQRAAVSASTSFEAVDQARKLPVRPKEVLGLVVMTTGGNDLIHNYGRTPPREDAMYGATLKQAQPWVVGFSVRLEKIIQILGQKFPGGCQIFVANIYDPTDGNGDTTAAELPRWPDVLEILSAYNKVIERVAATHSHVHMVDMHREFLGHGVHCTQFWMPNYRSEDPHYWYGTNLEDPHDRGYDAIRRLFLIEMARVFRGG